MVFEGICVSMVNVYVCYVYVHLYICVNVCSCVFVNVCLCHWVMSTGHHNLLCESP